MAAPQSPPEKMMFQLTLRRRGISDQAVLRTMEEVPREAFVETGDAAFAYRDSALGIACGQTISQPFVVAYMTEQLQVQKSHRVLEIGTGSGYQAAVLSRLARHVYSVERIPSLARRAQQVLSDLSISNVSVKVFYGTYGWGEWAPYPVIVVTAASDQAPPPILEQLAEGGRLVIPLGDETEQVLVRIRRTGSGFEPEEHETFSFVPLLGRYGRPGSGGSTHS
jgi:protein-L-isoaspartate(D-aspartate) O-methyltransferase